MHEMALAEGILSVVLDAAGQEPVSRVELSVGSLQLVVPESLQFSFELVSAGTPAEKAIVQIRDVPARLRCRQCNAETVLERPPFLCGECGAMDIEVITGDEVLVDAVELENGAVIRRRPVAAKEILAEHMREHHAHDDPRGKAPP